MKYLSSVPFSSKPSSKEYRDHYDDIDWSDEKEGAIRDDKKSDDEVE